MAGTAVTKAPTSDVLVAVVPLRNEHASQQIDFSFRYRWNWLEPGPPQPYFITLQRLLI
jgi:hypothetical protein